MNIWEDHAENKVLIKENDRLTKKLQLCEQEYQRKLEDAYHEMSAELKILQDENDRLKEELASCKRLLENDAKVLTDVGKRIKIHDEYQKRLEGLELFEEVLRKWMQI